MHEFGHYDGVLSHFFDPRKKLENFNNIDWPQSENELFMQIFICIGVDIGVGFLLLDTYVRVLKHWSLIWPKTN